MKKIFNILPILAIIAATSSCGKINPPEPYPAELLKIIKMTPELQAHVFVSPIVDSVIIDENSYYKYTLCYGDGLVLCNPTKADSINSDFFPISFSVIRYKPLYFVG